MDIKLNLFILGIILTISVSCEAVKCIQCNSTDKKCQTEDGSFPVTDCPTESTQCFTLIEENGNIKRGCVSNITEKSDGNNYQTCTGDGCNNVNTNVTIATETRNIAVRATTSCYKCRSDENAKCADAYAENNYKSEPCRNAMTLSGDLLCYIERWNGIVIRSCLADADEKSRKNCLDTNQKTCKTCKGDNCNTEKAPDSAYSIALTSGLLAACLLVLKFF
ncbi:uncharacterized protein LOC129905621 [Episyrphus balteatus]|uniref:uncharacterized protein LOC129905621 n=1 Tax=Episyrphus balteatus TaxID=286459 RepID=UPI002486554D|nr:uncharacterized protein LOC129905621 [Episyrphus balteatus]